MGTPDMIEFFNPNSFAVDIGKWWLSDERNDPQRYSIPAGTTVPALGYLVMDETQFNTGPTGVAFNADGERCYLFSADANGLLTGYSHGFQFAASDRDVTFGRQVASDGTEDFPSQVSATFGAANSGPLSSPVVISEVMFSHPFGPGYIELRNLSSAPVNLWDPQNPQSTWIVGSPVPAWHHNPGEWAVVDCRRRRFIRSHLLQRAAGGAGRERRIDQSVLRRVHRAHSAAFRNDLFAADYSPMDRHGGGEIHGAFPLAARGSSWGVARADRLNALGKRSDELARLAHGSFRGTAEQWQSPTERLGRRRSDRVHRCTGGPSVRDR